MRLKRLEMKRGMRYAALAGVLVAALTVLSSIAIGQEEEAGEVSSARNETSHKSMTPEQRAEAMRKFLGLGPVPDRAAAALGAPVYRQNCAFCHGPLARGATAPSLVTSGEVLDDEHGERLAAFLKKGRPEKGMPAFATMPDARLKDIAEFLHLQVEEVANRGAYHVLNIVVGNAAKGESYVAAHCMECHRSTTFEHFASRFRSPDQLQRGWIWPSRSAEPLAITATVKTPRDGTLTGRVTQVSDFRITLIDSTGRAHCFERGPETEVQVQDPLAPHQAMITTLTNDAMHDVTAYLETLR